MVLPLGFQDSPHIFVQTLAQELNDNSRGPPYSNVYGFLLCGPTEPTISRVTESLLNFLTSRGYKVSREKAQLCSFKVKYLGLVITNQTWSLGSE
jgi:hypothetical protein